MHFSTRNAPEAP